MSTPPLPPADPSFETWSDPAPEDRILRRALALAVLAHLGLLALHLPELQAERPPELESPRVFVYQAARIKDRPPVEPAPPVREVRREPMPDPTPDGPEPLRSYQPSPRALEVPLPELALDVPDAPPPFEAGPIQIDGSVVAPVKVHAPPPRYPELARRARIQGLVIVEAIVETTGTVSSVRLLRTLPMGLGEAAADAIKSWRFEPATRDGRPVAVYYHLTVHFSLEGGR